MSMMGAISDIRDAYLSDPDYSRTHPLEWQNLLDAVLEESNKNKIIFENGKVKMVDQRGTIINVFNN